MEPTRVTLYGLFPVTWRRYVTQSVIEWGGLVVLLAAWYWGWPTLARRLAVGELPTAMIVVRAILLNMPWIVLGLAIFKIVEMYVVVRAFRRKTNPSSSGNHSDGQTPLSPLSGSGPGGETPDS